MEEKEIVVQPETAPAPTEVQERIDDLLDNRKHIIEKVRPLLVENVDIYQFEGMNKPSLGKPGAEKLAAIFGLKANFKIDKETMEAIGAQANGKQYVAYVCTLLTKRGAFAGEGRGATFVEWERNSYRRIFNSDKSSLSAEETARLQGPFRATSKKNGQPYEFWKLAETPVFDPLALNKAIKMSQKSAFVDAVIRTTGMSDLFTQDIEDMDHAPADDRDVEPPKKPSASAPVEGEVVDTKPSLNEKIERWKQGQPAENAGALVCPFCGNKHNGQYPKCRDCWKAEKDGAVLVPKQKQKTIVNPDAPPFP